MTQVLKTGECLTNIVGAVTITELINSPDNEGLSVAIVNISGENHKVVNTQCTMYYYVLEGAGWFDFEDENFIMGKGDSILIQPNTPYQDGGEMTLLAVSTPRFNPDQQIIS